MCWHSLSWCDTKSTRYECCPIGLPCGDLVRVPGDSGGYVGNSKAKYICVAYSLVLTLELVMDFSTLINGSTIAEDNC
jgi:hypothetical protein